MLFRSNMFRWSAALALVVVLIAPAAFGQTGSASDSAALANELQALYRSQAANGALSFDGPLAFYERYPVMASMCLDAHRDQPNAALVSQSASAINRYFEYLFGERDRDRDLLMETTFRNPRGDLVDIEEVGFNSLLSFDMMSLASLYLEIRKPYRALYWYVAARAVQEAIVHSGLDADAGYFFPTGTGDEQPLRQYFALAASPLLFPGLVGDNHGGAMVREYLLNPVARAPESAFDYLGGPTVAWTDDVSGSGRLLRSLVMLRILESRGFHDDASTFRAQLASRARADAMTLPDGGVPSAHHEHLVGLLEGTTAGSLHRPTMALDLLHAVLRTTRTLKDNELVRLESAARELEAFVGTRVTELAPGDFNAASRHVVAAYMAVSAAREKLDEQTLIPSKAYREMGGIDPTHAMGRVLDDVTIALREADNRIFQNRFQDAGLHVSATLLRDRAISGSEIEVKWTIGAHNQPVSILEASVTTGSQSSPLVESGSPLSLAPGVTQTLTSRFTVDHERVDAFVPVTLTLDLDVGEGERARYHAPRTVYVEHPVDIAATFPAGRKLVNGSLPIDVVITKKTPDPVTVQYQWFSPTRIAPAEGQTAEYAMPAHEDSASLQLNVLVPPECRPGRFPFKLRFVAGGVDIGVISSNLFKPYEWVFAGPFALTTDPMTQEYPPQRGVRVLDVYDDPNGATRWAVTGDGIYTDRGEISFRRLLAKPGVGFLHTAVRTGYDTTLPVFMYSTSPAELFVNGQSVLRLDASPGAAPSYARIALNSGVNEVTLKVTGDTSTRVFFNLGDENDDASFSFNNSLSELLDGYATLVRRGQGEEAIPRDVQKLITLTYSDPSAQAVAVIGTFNGWSPDQSRMQRAADGHWEIVLSLPPGRYSYRFLVNERQQVLDPSSPNVEPDGFGGKNSVMVIE